VPVDTPGYIALSMHERPHLSRGRSPSVHVPVIPCLAADPDGTCILFRNEGCGGQLPRNYGARAVV